MSDDHAAAAVSAYGSKVNVTPNIDRLATEGARLTNTFCTNALCTPSRASILTGQYSHVNGVKTLEDEIDSARPVQVQKILQSAGYQTAIIGKWHLGNNPASNPQGFDYWNVLPGQGDYWDPTFHEMGNEIQYSGYVTDIITDKAVEWLDDISHDKPFCLMVHHKAPHSPWEPAERHLELGVEGEFPEPDTLQDDYSTRSEAVKFTSIKLTEMRDANVKVERPTGLSDSEMRSWIYQRYMTDYTRTIQAVDDSVGTLLDYLDSHGLADNTLVVYTSDQGMFLGDHGWHDKRFMYEESLRMPFLARLPGEIPAGSVVDDWLLNVDFAPTLLEFAGLDAPSDMQGRSGRASLMSTTSDRSRSSMYYRYWMHWSRPAGHRLVPHYGVRTDRYKLIFYYGGWTEESGGSEFKIPQEWELYDLEQDPRELNNLYEDPGYAEVRRELVAELDRLQAEYGDVGVH